MKRRDSHSSPSFELEQTSIRLGLRPIAGVDEAGRGPWAGPVVAAAVILDPNNIPHGINDSKALDETTREILFKKIRESSVVAVAVADTARIDRENILNATMWAMREAVLALSESPSLVLVDGNRPPPIDCECRTIIRGDSKCLTIAAASIIAKVTRDRLMTELASEYPGYGFERHKGYGTPEHKRTLAQLGACAIHRRSFRPVQLALGILPAAQ